MQAKTVPVQLDRTLEFPLHRQMADQLQQAIEHGVLVAGDQLPSVRQWSQRLDISPSTVMAAYGVLEQRQLVQAAPRSGFRVATRLGSAHTASLAKELLEMDRIVPHLPLHPVSEFGQIVAEVALAGSGSGGYEDYRGYAPLLEQVVSLARAKGIPAVEQQIMIAAGTQHALHLVALALSPGDRVLVEQPAYPGALRLLEHFGAELLPVPMTTHGPDLAVVRDHLHAGPVRLMYACPTYQNPTGHSYSHEVRRALVGLAERHGFKIFEDDYLGDLDYLGEHLPTLKSLDSGGSVIYSCTFSKCLLPSLRIAYVIGDEGLIDRMVRRRAIVDICGSAYLERALALFLSRGLYAAHIRRIRPHYRRVRAAFESAMTALSGALRYEMPQAGLSLFCALPGSLHAAPFALECQNAGLKVSVGNSYFIGASTGHSAFRLTYSALSPEEIGMVPERLRRALERTQAHFDVDVL